MDQKRKTRRRGFVMTGGGAKGLYEAEVLNAFHLTAWSLMSLPVHPLGQ